MSIARKTDAVTVSNEDVFIVCFNSDLHGIHLHSTLLLS